jgi:diguanylate cyclase (GGDEF)-like protein
MPLHRNALRSRQALLALALAIAALALLFASVGQLKPVLLWRWVDIAGEGGLAVLATAWTVGVLASRPTGRVTAWLAGGLAALSLAAWADALDECFKLPADATLLVNFESVMGLLGIVVLSAGLRLWRQEEAMLREQLGPREQGQRDHRHFDRQTRLADAAYLRQRLAEEARPPAVCSVLMLELAQHLALEKQHGPAAARRLLQACIQQVLLNLRPQDLVCRYAGARWVVLMPGTPLATAQQRAQALRAQLQTLTVYDTADGPALPCQVHSACAAADTDAQATLTALCQALDAQAQGLAAPAAPGAATRAPLPA